MDVERVEPQFLDHLRELWYHRRVALVVALAVGGVVLLWRLSVPETYAAEVSLWVRPADEPVRADDEAELLARTYAELATAPLVVDQIAAQLADVSPSTVKSALRATAADTPGFVDLVAEGPSPEAAERLADAAAVALSETARTDGFATQGSPSGDAVQIVVLDAADAGGSPIAPQPRSEALLAGLVALIATGEGLILWRWLRDRVSPIRAEAEVEALVGAPALDLAGSDAVSRSSFFGRHLDRGLPLAVVGVGDRTGAAAAVSVAETVARAGRRVLLVDTDLASPVLAAHLGLPSGPGLAEVLFDGRDWRSVAAPLPGGSGAMVMTAGLRAREAVPLLGTQALTNLLRHTGAQLPVLVAGGREGALRVVSQFPYSVLLSADRSRSTRQELAGWCDDIRSCGGTISAVVLHTTDRSRPGLPDAFGPWVDRVRRAVRPGNADLTLAGP